MFYAKLKYGMFSNWDYWVFLRRHIDQDGNDILYVSDWIGRDRARLAWAAVVMQASRN